MKINQAEFCALSTAEMFLTWLYRNSPAMHTELIDHLKKSQGCKANRTKMIELLERMQKDTTLITSLHAFISEFYPQLIVDGNKPVVAPAPKLNKHAVFTHYDPDLASYPRRMILVARSGSDLARDTLNYCIKHAYCEHIIIEDRAYIEYLEMEHIKLKDKIPAKNWEIRAYKVANGLK